MIANSEQAMHAAEPSPPIGKIEREPKQAKKTVESIAEDVIEEGKTAARRVGQAAAKPVTGAAIVGAVVVAAAVLWGAAEAAVGAGAAYLAYRLLRKRSKIEHGSRQSEE
jgi:hypothetical protein